MNKKIKNSTKLRVTVSVHFTKEKKTFELHKYLIILKS